MIMKRTVAKLIAKLILVSSPFLLLSAYCAIFHYDFVDGTALDWMLKRDYALHENEENSLIIIGDSRAEAAFQPALLSENAFNFAVSGGIPLGGYYQMKQYLTGHSKPKTVIVGYSAFHMFEYDFWEVIQSPHSVDFSDTLEIYSVLQEHPSNAIESDSYWTNYFGYKTYMLHRYAASLRKINGRQEQNSELVDMVLSGCGHRFYGTERQNNYAVKEARYADFEPDALQCYYLDKLLALCDEEGITVIVEPMPFTEASREALTPEFKQSYTEFLQKLQKDHPYAHVNTEPQYRPADWFGDNSHLNSYGSEQYCNEILENWGNFIS